MGVLGPEILERGPVRPLTGIVVVDRADLFEPRTLPGVRGRNSQALDLEPRLEREIGDDLARNVRIGSRAVVVVVERPQETVTFRCDLQHAAHLEARFPVGPWS